MTTPARRSRTPIEISLDPTLVEAALRADLDIEAETERALKQRVAPALSPAEMIEMREQLARYDRFTEEHGLFSDAWRRF